MDGNGRWASQRDLPRLEGHRAGTENIRRITRRAVEHEIRYLTLWAFSTENWNRPTEEVEGILQILAEALITETDELHRQGARLRHIGSLDGLDPDLVHAIHEAIDLTKDNERITLTLAFNYGGRAEITQAVRRMLQDQLTIEHIDEHTIERYLYTQGMPDPDLIIRTSGEMRISNFFLWQAAYAEYIFTPVLWPDFSDDHLTAAVHEYQARERRFGGVVRLDAPPARQG
jgi:undecaprenyl diphosphate synthase